MFLLPALLAALTDATILYVGLRGRHNESGDNNDDSGNDSSNVDDSSPAAATLFLHILLLFSAIRLIILIYPLSHHTLKGTRIPYQKVYYLFHGLSLCSAAASLIWLLIIAEEHNSSGGWRLHVDLEPDGLPVGLHPILKGRDGSTEEIGDAQDGDDNDDIAARRQLQQQSFPVLIDHLWIISVLSLLSTMFHVVILVHVRSSAPMEHSIVQDDNKRKKRKVMAYYAYRRFCSGGDGDGSRGGEAAAGINTSLVNAGPVIVNLPDDVFPSRPSHSQISRGNSLVGSALGPRYDEIMSDLQYRLDSARRQWSARLEDVQRNLNAQFHGGDGIEFTLDGRGSDSPQMSPLHGFSTRVSSPIHGGVGRLLHLSPFQALLQLYAYEDVVSTGKLDRAFGIGNRYRSDEDSAAALAFYSPQLLSFLLHGAFLSSPQLEQWVMNCCRTNVHFAHRCFWFLRSWALGQGTFLHSTDVTDDYPLVPDAEASASVGATDAESLPSSSSMRSLSKRCSSENNLYLADTERQPEDATMTDDRPDYIRRNSKFPIEEHRLIEDLLERIVECGEEAVLQLKDDSLDGHTPADDETTTLFTGSLSPYQSTEDLVRLGWVPSSATGEPSGAHLRALQSSVKGKYDFRPRGSDGAMEDSFLTTPTFLDALTSIADDLMLVEKVDRTKELRDRLKSLELELLPSNVIYLPTTTNVHHQIWRVVPDESVALSTNERVPCIITFEVLSRPQDYEGRTGTTNLQERSVDEVARSIQDAVHGRASEGGTLKAWFREERPAQRHNTVRDKLSTFGRRLQHDFDANFHHQRDRLFEAVSPSTNGHGEILPPDIDEEVASASINKLSAESNAAQDIESLNKMESNSRPPMIPSGGASSSVGLKSRGKMTASSSVSSSRASSRPPSPNAELSMGQWHSPGLEKKKKVPSFSSRQEQEPPTSMNLAGKKQQHKKKRSRPPVVFKEDWSAKEERLRSKSAFGSDPNWRLLPVLVKSNDDCRQEQLASQIIHRCASILARAKIPVWLYPYEIIALSDRCGLIEAIPDTISLSSLKGNIPEYVDLKSFFVDHFGPRDSDDHAQAKANFVESLAAYSIVCYLLQIKDRHNGNILLTSRGHLIHIDFGFFFLSSPGKNSGFESAPFKFTSEYIDLLDGPDSHTFDKFRELCYKTFIELRKHCYQIILITEMLAESGEDLQCFRGQPERAIEELRQRFRLDLTDRACKQYVDGLIDESAGSWRTGFYDAYQRVCVGVL